MLSRVADCLYWMARYIERAENIARYVDVNLQAGLDRAGSGPAGRGQWLPLVAAAGDEALFRERHGEGLLEERAQEAVLHFLTFDPDYPNSILSCVCLARENARQARGYLNMEAREHLTRFYHMLGSSESRRRAAESPSDFYSEIRQASYLFEGISETTLSRGEEYHFLKLGRHLERADQTSRILDVKYFILLPDPGDVGSVVDDLLWGALLHSVSGFEMFRRRHGRISPDKVLEFLILDREFPRAILASLLRAPLTAGERLACLAELGRWCGQRLASFLSPRRKLYTSRQDDHGIRLQPLPGLPGEHASLREGAPALRGGAGPSAA